MDNSTPLRRSKSLRRTLLKNIDLPSDSPIAAQNVDDETERSMRRSFIDSQKRAQKQNQSPAINDSVRFSGEQEMKDHLKICTKLHAENKITERVAWQLQVIDLLRVMSKKEGSDTLQVASSALDVGTKVYSVRVDNIHAEGLKLASMMARFAQKHAQDNENEDHGDGEPGADGAAKPKRSKRKKIHNVNGPKNTIAKDPKSLFASLPKLDSTSFSVRIDSELSTVQNLFTNRLPMSETCHKFVIMSDEKAWPEGEDQSVNLDQVRDFDTTRLPLGGHICKSFEKFVLDKWDLEEEKREREQQLRDDVVVYDDQGIPIAELDGPLPDFDNDGVENDEDEPDQEDDFFVQQMHRDIAPVGDLLAPEDDLHRSEYSYNSLIYLSNGKVMDRIWAGPSHWKLKFIHRNRSHFTGATGVSDEVSAKRSRKKKLDPQPVDFFNVDEDEILNLKKLGDFKSKKRINNPSKVTLPVPDASCKELLNGIYELMTKPGTVSVPKRAVGEIEPETNLDDNQGQNEEDVNMDDGMDNFDNEPMDNDEGYNVEEVGMNQQQNFMGEENLVDAPEYVPKVYLPYAMQAKKMDMKKLKTYLWQVLTQSSTDEPSLRVVPTTFSKSYQTLGTVLPQSMKKELSCSLAFSALLHCCNDRGLKLTQLNNDFTIESL